MSRELQHYDPQRYLHEHRWMRNWNRGYLDWSHAMGFRPDATPIQIHLYSPVLQSFRLAARGLRPAASTPE